MFILQKHANVFNALQPLRFFRLPRSRVLRLKSNVCKAGTVDKKLNPGSETSVLLQLRNCNFFNPEINFRCLSSVLRGIPRYSKSGNSLIVENPCGSHHLTHTTLNIWISEFFEFFYNVQIQIYFGFIINSINDR